MKRKMVVLLLSVAVFLTGMQALVLAEETRVFVDDAGREVALPATIDRVVASGTTAQIALFAIAPEKLIAVSTAWTEEAMPYVGEAGALPVLGQLYNSGDLNLETLASLAPQVIVDVGEAKASMVEDMDGLQEQLGIPVVHIDAYLSSLGDTYRRLGELLGNQTYAEELAAFCDGIYGDALRLMEEVGEDRVDVLYVLGAEGLNVIAKGSYHGEVIDLLADNVAVLETPSTKGTGDPVDMEQMLLWEPDVILFGPDSIYRTVSEDPLWQSMRAIEAGSYAQTPLGPYNWLGFPPSVQRNLGILWMSDLLYPELVSFDLYETVSQYFSLFYHHDLTPEAFDALMEYAHF